MNGCWTDGQSLSVHLKTAESHTTVPPSSSSDVTCSLTRVCFPPLGWPLSFAAQSPVNSFIKAPKYLVWQKL